MEVDRGRLDWGIFLIALGGIPLAVQQGWLDADAVSDALRFWPLILVGIGLGLVLKLTPLAWVGGAIVALALGLLFGSMLAGGVSGIGSACIGTDSDGEETSRTGLAAGESFDLRVELTCGDLTVAREDASTWTIEAHYGPDREPIIDGTSSYLDVRPGGTGAGFLAFGQQPRNTVAVLLPAEPALAVDVTLNAASGDLVLGPGPMHSLSGTFNASDAGIDLSDASTPTPMSVRMTFNAAASRLSLPAGSIEGGMTLNASSLEICLAEGAEVRIAHTGTLSSADFSGSDLVKDDGGWQTPGYADASERIDLVITSTVSSVSVKEGACS